MADGPLQRLVPPEFQIFIITDAMTPVWICEKAKATYLSYLLVYSDHETWEEEVVLWVLVWIKRLEKNLNVSHIFLQSKR